MELAAPGIKKEYCRVAINDEGILTITMPKTEPKEKVTKAIEVLYRTLMNRINKKGSIQKGVMLLSLFVKCS